MADVAPRPKEETRAWTKKDLRPVSLTPCVSKVVEEFVVEGFVKPAVLDVITVFWTERDWSRKYCYGNSIKIVLLFLL